MINVSRLGSDWLRGEINGLTDCIAHIKPSDYTEETRYMLADQSPKPGPYRFGNYNPFMREIIDNFSADSPVRETNLMKGTQITYSTILESIILYGAGHLKTTPMLFLTSTNEYAQKRLAERVLPMFRGSGMMDIIQSNDVGNNRKTGLTKDTMQWRGGGWVNFLGVQNPAQLRERSVPWVLKDEIDGWPQIVGSDGCPDILSDTRTDAYSQERKIFRGSTPVIEHTSKIYKRFLEGDIRRYYVPCLKCGYHQFLTWEFIDKQTGQISGIVYDLDKDGKLVEASVGYSCIKCGYVHCEEEKTDLFSLERGAEWRPTNKKHKDESIRSYHLPSLYSPVGGRSWADQVKDYLKAIDYRTGRTRDVGQMQIHYNRTLGWPFKEKDSKRYYEEVSNHRRTIYQFGEIPNEYAEEFSGSKILFLTMQVDVHKTFLAISVTGWTKGGTCYLIEYWHEHDEDCIRAESPVWLVVKQQIQEAKYVSDDGYVYEIQNTFIDASWGDSTDLVVSFCAQWPDYVIPIMGKTEISKAAPMKMFTTTSKTSMGTNYVLIKVDAYKDRLAGILKREWDEILGTQNDGHYNVPTDISKKQLNELTKEYKAKITNPKTNEISFEWKRPNGSRNELWDLMVYAYCQIDYLAYREWVEVQGHKSVNMNDFWEYMAHENNWRFRKESDILENNT